jgi:hypothetical protein
MTSGPGENRLGDLNQRPTELDFFSGAIDAMSYRISYLIYSLLLPPL